MLHSTRRSGRSGYLPQSARTGVDRRPDDFDHSAPNAATKKSVSFAFSSPPATANATTTNPPKPACSSTDAVRPAASQLQAATSAFSDAIRRTPRPLGSGRKDGGKPLRQAGAEALKGFELKSDYLLQRALNEKSASSAAGATVTDSARAAVVQTISARSDNFERAAPPQSSAAGSHGPHQHMTRPSYMTPVVLNAEQPPHPHSYPRHEQVQDREEQPNPIPNTERSGTSSSATSRSRQQSARGQQGGAGAERAQQNMELDAADQARVYEYFRNMQLDDEERQAEEALQRQNKYESGGFSAREEMYERSNAIRNEARNRNFSHTTPFANHYERDGGEFVGSRTPLHHVRDQGLHHPSGPPCGASQSHLRGSNKRIFLPPVGTGTGRPLPTQSDALDKANTFLEGREVAYLCRQRNKTGSIGNLIF